MKSLLKPMLDKPVPHWSHDLPLPTTETPVPPRLSSLLINHSDGVYLEIPRSTFRIRGVSVWLSFLFGAMGVASSEILIDEIFSGGRFDILLFICAAFMAASSFWTCIYMWRMDTAAPRDEPIRFNRALQKIYVYRFHHDGRRPLSRTAWFTRVEVFDWGDVRAEACNIYGPMGTGGLIEAIVLSVVKPGTNKVIDRFHFAHGGYEAEKYWTMARLDMQKGPEALPQFDRPPRDWNNEERVFNLARYLAPKVEWPEDLDIESRTAPS